MSRNLYYHAIYSVHYHSSFSVPNGMAILRPISRFIWEMMQDRAIVTMEWEYETAPKLSNGTSLNDFEWPLTQISRSRYYSTSNKSKTVQDRAIFTIQMNTIQFNSWPIESRIWSIECRHFQRPWTIHTSAVKVSPFFDAEYLRNGTRYIVTHALLNNVVSNDLDWLCKIFNDTKRARSLCDSLAFCWLIAPTSYKERPQ